LQHKSTSYETLPYLTLPYLTLPYLTLPYLTLPYGEASCKQRYLPHGIIAFFLFIPLVFAEAQTICTAAQPFDETGVAIAYINNLTSDCMSNDWYVHFIYANGTDSYYTSQMWAESNPGSMGWYNFNQPFWQCCDPLPLGSNGFAPNPMDLCPCEWEINSSGELVIDCSGC
jgi:hypothetical protein